MYTYTVPDVDELLTRGVDEVIDRAHLAARLTAGEKLRIKFGIDPTSPHIHVGRSVLLLKLRDFQLLGHMIVLVIGDFTGVIGDTSDKDAERKILTHETVAENLQTYAEQAGRILDMGAVEVRHNTEWLAPLSYREVALQADAFSLAEFAARKNIRERLDAGKRVSLRELLYPLMQGYDSVVLKADAELGGTDQRFNLLAGRTMQEHYHMPPQDILTARLIPGLDGRKMSSSWGNTINITDDPVDMFGKVMSMADEAVESYFVSCTRLPQKELAEDAAAVKAGTLHPRDYKMKLARELTGIYWGEDAARGAEERFVAQFQKKEIPNNIPTLVGNTAEPITELLVRAGFAASRAAARRLVASGGVSVDGTKITDPAQALRSGGVLKVGKRKLVRVML